MQQSVIYQEWREEFLQEGRQKGRQEGCHEEGQSLVLHQLSHRIGEITLEKRSQIQALSLPQLEALGEALLDFTKPEDLEKSP